MAPPPADFAAFYAIHVHDPFPWQQELVEQLTSNNRWPEVLDLPTCSGKTAGELPAGAALRIVLVVDRRLVVDDAESSRPKNRRRLA